MRLLLATDGSPAAGIAVDLVAGIEWPMGTTVDVVEIVETGPAVFGGPWPTLPYAQIDQIESEVLRVGRETVDAASARLRESGLDAAGSVHRGRPAVVIAELASSSHADLIVVGSRGHGTIELMVLGSVSAEAIDRASVPVLVARTATLTRVVLAWDGSESAGGAAALVRDWPIFLRVPVRVVSVADLGAPWWTGFPEPGAAEGMSLYLDAAAAVRGESNQLAAAMAHDLQDAGREADAELRQGGAAAEIIGAARASGADLIVLGTHGRTGIARLLLGSVARNVLLHAPSSVLVARGI